jgi:hypothetical protein
MRPARVWAGVTLLAALAVLSSGGLTGQDKDKKGPESAKAAKGQLPAGWVKLELTDAQKGEVLRGRSGPWGRQRPLRAFLVSQAAHKRYTPTAGERASSTSFGTKQGEPHIPSSTPSPGRPPAIDSERRRITLRDTWDAHHGPP